MITDQEPLVPEHPEYYQEEYEVERIVKHKKAANGSPRFFEKDILTPPVIAKLTGGV